MKESFIGRLQSYLTEGLSIHQVEERDHAFIRSVFHAICEDKLPIPDPALKEQLIRMQFEARQHTYRQHYPESILCIIKTHEQNLGVLQLGLSSNQIHLINIEILPSKQGTGLGKAVLKALQHLAQSLEMSIGLSVSKENNRAFNFYTTMGFQKESSESVYVAMRWTP